MTGELITSWATLIIGMTLAFSIYFLPTILADGHPHRPAIFVVNLFLGWTFVFWVLALAWACTGAPKKRPARRAQ